MQYVHEVFIGLAPTVAVTNDSPAKSDKLEHFNVSVFDLKKILNDHFSSYACARSGNRID